MHERPQDRSGTSCPIPGDPPLSGRRFGRPRFHRAIALPNESRLSAARRLPRRSSIARAREHGRRQVRQHPGGQVEFGIRDRSRRRRGPGPSVRSNRSKLPDEMRATIFSRASRAAGVAPQFFWAITPETSSKLFSSICFAVRGRPGSLACGRLQRVTWMALT